MPLFRYKAVAPGGAVSTGELSAANEAEILDRLRDQGLMPMQVAPVTGAPSDAAPARASRAPRRRWFESRRVTADQLMALTRELATLLRAGLPLDRALETLIGLAPTPAVNALLQGLRDEVRGGKALSQALDARREVFSRFYVNIVRAGEAGGALATVLTRLADTMERNKDLRDTVKSALIYPVILIGVAVTSVMILLIYVVPQFQQTFSQAGKALPLPTLVVIWAGTFLKQWWWALIAGVAAAVAWFRRKLAQQAFRGRFDARMLALPLVGDLVAKVEVARFSRTLATLLGNGVTLLAGLSIVKETMGNAVLGASLEGVTAHLR
ncbi:MAG: type II secretion system F family protein, partial [Burkholderiales bacterium]|nr:type II secretion system F family protein [Burkholderiales bacterium]